MRIRLLAMAVMAAFVALLPAPAHAAGGTSYTWIGSSQDPAADNHSWTDARNWSPNGVPGNGDSVSIAQPNGTHCTAHVDDVPTVTLAGFRLLQTPDLCGTSINGGQITVTGTFTWDGGVLNTATTVAAGAAGTIGGTNGELDVLSQNLDVGGTLGLSGLPGTSTTPGDPGTPALRIVNPFVLHVLPGGTLTSTGDNKVNFLSCCNNPARITNEGTVAVDGGTFEVDAVAFDQDGTISASNGGRLLSTAAPVTAGDGASYEGSGSWTIHDHSHAVLSGTQMLGPDFHLELGTPEDQAGGTLQGTAVLEGTGTFDWSGTTIEAALTVAHGVTLRASGEPPNNGRRILAGMDGSVPTPLTVHGRFVVDDGAVIGTGVHSLIEIASDGTLSLAPGSSINGDSCCVSPDQVVNHGTLVVPSGTGVADIHNEALDSDGTISLADDAVVQANLGVTLSGGTLLGAGTVAADLDNVAGKVRPAGSGTGTLTVDGGYDQGKRAELDVDLTAGAGDRLAVTGTATVGGRLAAHDAGGYHPRLKDVRTVLSAASVAGSLRCVTTSGAGSTGTHAGHWQAKASGRHVRLTWVDGRHTSC
ncbi:hypothetical protein [Nocardioides panacisoli]|uniref:Uncharacterized protein n=1 Tax=Nocardioides panacisoli TaxID=627624 RepID=A0ABP7IQV3_9ACTN